MSIDAVRKLVEGRGCVGVGVTIISSLIAAAFIVPATCGRNLGTGQEASKAESKVIAKVGSYNLMAQYVEKLAERSSNGPVTASQEASEMGFGLGTLLDSGYALALANKKGLNLSDDSILADVTKQIGEQLDIMKMQAQMSGGLKGTTDADFDAYLKSTQGADRKALTARVLDDLKLKLKDPSSREQIVAEMAKPALVTQESAKVNLTEADIKKQFDQLDCKRVFIRFTNPDDPKAVEVVKKAQADIKAGNPFELVMDRYSGDTPDPGKKVSESKSTVTGSMILTDPLYKPLGLLKVGEVSEPIKLEAGYAIYKLMGIKQDVPKDFEQNKARYIKSLTNGIAQRSVEEAINQIKKDVKPVWQSKGYELVYRLSQLRTERKSQQEMQEAWSTIEKEASSINDPIGEKPAALARYVAISELLASSDPKSRTDLQGRHVEAIQQVLKYTEGVDLRLELVEALRELKKGPEASEALLQAAQNNNDVEMRGQTYFNMINSRKAALKDAKLLSPEAEKAIDEEQNRWKTERAEKDKADAERKKQEAAERLQAEQERKKAEEEKKNLKPKARDEVGKDKP